MNQNSKEIHVNMVLSAAKPLRASCDWVWFEFGLVIIRTLREFLNQTTSVESRVSKGKPRQTLISFLSQFPYKTHASFT